MAPDGPSEGPKLPEAAKPNEILNLHVAELDRLIKEITVDLNISESEVIPFRVATLRRNAVGLVTRVDTLEAQLKIQEERADPAAAVTRTSLEEALIQLRDNNEMIINEIGFLRTIEAYSKIQREYKATRDSMRAKSFNTDIGNADRTAARERIMDAQMQRILDALKARAAVVDLRDAYQRWYDAHQQWQARLGQPDAETLRATAERHRTTFERKYRGVIGGDAPRDRANPLVYSGAVSRIASREIEAVDNLYSNINHSREPLSKVEKFYRTIAWQIKGLIVPTEAFDKELKDFVAAQKAARFGDDAEVKAAVEGLERVWGNPSRTVADAQAGIAALPKTAVESALLQGELLESWANQLADSKDVNADARKECVNRLNASLSLLFRLQQTYVRELGGYEHVRVQYQRDPSLVGLDPGKPDTLRDEQRGLARQRTGNLLSGLQAMRAQLDPTAGERIRGIASTRIVEPARRIYSGINRLVPFAPDPVAEPGGETVPDILKGYDQKVIDNLEKSVSIYDRFLAIPEMEPSRLTRARAALKPEEMEGLVRRADAQPDMTVEEAERMAKTGDDKTRIMLWIWIAKRLDKDMEAFEAEQEKLLTRLEKSGTAGKKLADGFRILGVQWQWWLAGLAALVAGIWLGSKAYRAIRGTSESRATDRARRAADARVEAATTVESEARVRTLEAALEQQARVERLVAEERARGAGGRPDTATDVTVRDSVRVRGELDKATRDVIDDIRNRRTDPAKLSDIAIDTCRAKIVEIRRGGAATDLTAVDEALRTERARPRRTPGRS